MEVQQIANAVISNSASLITLTKYIAATFILAIGTLAAAIAQGKIASKACESLAQNEKAEASIKSTFFIGILFVETCALYCFILSMIFIFVL